MLAAAQRMKRCGTKNQSGCETPSNKANVARAPLLSRSIRRRPGARGEKDLFVPPKMRNLPVISSIAWIVASIVLWLTPIDALQLKMEPLIGGPSWLPLHVQVVLDGTDKWDFVPQNATNPTTLKSLIMLKSVPGEIRYFPARNDQNDNNNNDAIRMTRQAQAFVDSYTNRDLQLIQNNCWTFALLLYWHLYNTARKNEERG